MTKINYKSTDYVVWHKNWFIKWKKYCNDQINKLKRIIEWNKSSERWLQSELKKALSELDIEKNLNSKLKYNLDYEKNKNKTWYYYVCIWFLIWYLTYWAVTFVFG